MNHAQVTLKLYLIRKWLKTFFENFKDEHGTKDQEKYATCCIPSFKECLKKNF